MYEIFSDDDFKKFKGMRNGVIARQMDLNLPSDRQEQMRERKRIGLNSWDFDELIYKEEMKKSVKVYVRHIDVIEERLYFNNQELNKYIKVFSRVRKLGLSHMCYITDEFFNGNVMKEVKELVYLNIRGSIKLTVNCFYSHIVKNLKELEIGSGMMKSLNESKKVLKFPKLEKLTIRAGNGGSCSWRKPTVYINKFGDQVLAENLKVINFEHVDMEIKLDDNLEGEGKNDVKYLTVYKMLKRLFLFDVSVNSLKEKGSIFENLLNLPWLEELKLVNTEAQNSYFQNLSNLRRLIICGGKYLNSDVYVYFPKLEYLDISYCESLNMFSYDTKENSFSKKDLDFFSKLKTVKLCCDELNFNSNKENIKQCQCVAQIKNIPQENLLQNIRDNKDRIIHFQCDKCSKCDECKKEVMCRKLEISSCKKCQKPICGQCKSFCEKCGCSFCPCTRVKFFMGFCNCDYESLCEECVNSLSRCDGCNKIACMDCMSRCFECKELMCWDCIRTFGDNDDEIQNPICKTCQNDE